jgi:ppGpp synthetase/RelA/SpoT-type nucleotidyltranferase
MPSYEAFSLRIHALLEELLKTNKIPFSQIEHRAKTLRSFMNKLERKKYENPFTDIKDLAGIRVITYYQDDLKRLLEVLQREFTIDQDHSIDKLDALNINEFGYRSHHLIVSLKSPRKELIEWKDFADFSAEIQVRSILQHAWAAISHKLDYKTAAQAPSEMLRQLFRLSALLELADEQFSLLRDSDKNIISRYEKELAKGELDISIDLYSLKEYVHSIINLREWFQLGIDAGLKPDPDQETPVEIVYF